MVVCASHSHRRGRGERVAVSKYNNMFLRVISDIWIELFEYGLSKCHYWCVSICYFSFCWYPVSIHSQLHHPFCLWCLYLCASSLPSILSHLSAKRRSTNPFLHNTSGLVTSPGWGEAPLSSSSLSARLQVQKNFPRSRLQGLKRPEHKSGKNAGGFEISLIEANISDIDHRTSVWHHFSYYCQTV